MAQTWLFSGAVSGFVSVAMGAFGAHALTRRLDERALAIYQTAAHYQIVHALALVAVGLWTIVQPSRGLTVAGYSFLWGSIVFSGSLYALALSGYKLLGAVTPIGGVLFLIGWASLAWAAIK